ncbi:MAG: FadR family transcriptional regulator [Lachnospiraceae bacterium]|nr:FadR family transcriptional regulator [Lachnospiraceae bacterium]
MPIRSIGHQNMTDAVFDQLTSMITNGEWKPGDKIPSEMDLAQLMGVSRITIRAAIQRLVSLGILSRQQGSGTVIREYAGADHISNLMPMLVLTMPDLKVMTEYRIILECGAAELAASRCTPDDLLKLKANYAKQEHLTKAREDTSQIDLQFHFLIAETSRNPLVIQTEQIMRASFLTAMQSLKKFTDDELCLYYHSSIINALEANDPVQAQKLMRDHLDNNLKMIREEEEKQKGHV